MDTFMVTLADAEGRDQRILVKAQRGTTVDEIHDFILDPATRGTNGETVIDDARVIGIRKLHLKRPVHTVMPEVLKA